MARETSSGRPPVVTDESSPVPDTRTLEDGQHADHWVLSTDERAKGFIRPLRRSYRHVGAPGPSEPLRDLTPDERARYADYKYVKYEPYPESALPVTGRFWTQAQLDQIGKGCGTVTTMRGHAIVETYARDPGFYSSTFCCGCHQYLPVGKDGEFVWDGTTERVGT